MILYYLKLIIMGLVEILLWPYRLMLSAIMAIRNIMTEEKGKQEIPTQVINHVGDSNTFVEYDMRNHTININRWMIVRLLIILILKGTVSVNNKLNEVVGLDI